MAVLNLLFLATVFQSLRSHASPFPHANVFRRQNFTVGQPITTPDGMTVVGNAATGAPDVSEYLGIPFAQPPVGDLRFAPPQPFDGAGKTINATQFGAACPSNHNNSTLPTTLPGGLTLAGDTAIRLLAELDQFGNTFSEDCLTLNVWTKPQTGNESKAVLVWIYGGGFQTGSTQNPSYNGEYFAENQDVVLVSINYRLNIFGFPGVQGVDGVAQNPGLLDQRLAIEWVRDNVAAFSGDPDRITIFGQSAGAASVDFYNYAYVSDPIIAGSIAESGTATAFEDPAAPNNTEAFFNTSIILGCPGPASGIQAAVDCVRTKPYQDLLSSIIVTNPLEAVLGIFQPTADNQTVFSDYPARSAAGNFIKKPYFIGNNDYEAGLFKILAAGSNSTANFPDVVWSIFNLVTFTCPVSDAANARAAAGVPVWRYRYFGEFPNLRLTISPSSGAWHGSEIAVVFGTAEDASGVPDTTAEASISAYLQGAWASFAKDPAGAFTQAPYAFAEYNESTPSLIEFAQCNSTTPFFQFPVTYDLACPTIETLNAAIPGGLLGAFESASASGGSLANLTALLPANITELGGGGGTVLGGMTPCPLPQ